MGEARNYYDESIGAEEAALLKRSRAHQYLGEWTVGEAGWLPPDDFLGGEEAELRSPDLPPYLGDSAIRLAGQEPNYDNLTRALDQLERIKQAA